MIFAKDLSKKYGQKPLDSAKKSTTDAIEAASKRAIQKTTGDLIGSKIADKITSVLEKSPTALDSKNDDANSQIEVPKKDTYLQKKGNKLLMN